MAALCTRYLEEHASKKRQSSRRDDAGMIRAFILPAFGTRKVAGISFSDCDGLRRKITCRGSKHRANRVIALLSKAFNLSIRWGWRHDNPCRGIERNPEGKRTRVSQRRRARPPDRGPRHVRRPAGCQHRPPATPDRRPQWRGACAGGQTSTSRWASG